MLRATGVLAAITVLLPAGPAALARPAEDAALARPAEDVAVALPSEDVAVDDGPTTQTLALSGVADDVAADLPTTPPVPADETGTRADDLATEPIDPDVLTLPRSTADFSVLGFTWDKSDGSDDATIRYRVHTEAGWSEWDAVGASDLAPDPGSPDAHPTDRVGTDAIVALGADGIQVWAQSDSGDVDGLKAVLVDPGTPAASDVARGATVSRAGSGTRDALSSSAGPAQPTIISRAQWGADESLRWCEPDYSTSIVSAAVHHTASTNDYTAADVPAILNGILAFHTRPESQGGRGWCDIGYNFLVDRFGRIFEGRRGSIDTTVVGVHTGGFNSRTIGISAIGDYATVAPSTELLESLSQLIAWRFGTLGISGGSSVTMTSGGGASKWPLGTVVTFPTVYGHRDAQTTACPGQFLYDRLPQIRSRVAELVDAVVAASPRGSVDTLRGTATSVFVGGWAYDRGTPSATTTVRVVVDGVTVRSVAADGSRPDVGAAFGVGDRHGYTADVPVAAGQHVVCLWMSNVGDGSDVTLGCRWVEVRNHDPQGAIDTAVAASGGVRVAGWALDVDTTASVDVHVYVDGTFGTAVTATGRRPDIAAAFGRGDAHGFDLVVPTRDGTHQVCVYAINVPTGGNPPLGCRTVTVGHPPTGAVDTASARAGSLTVAGWALDPDTSASVAVHVYVDGTWRAAGIAADARPDIAAVFGLGASHGYNLDLPITTGAHEVCVWAIDTAGGDNRRLGCRSLVVDSAPVSSLDTARSGSGTIVLAGWALDRDTTNAAQLHVYVDGRFVTTGRAGDSRSDVGARYGLGDFHGFNLLVPSAPGVHEACVWVIDWPTGAHNSLVGCRAVTVVNRAPMGSLDTVAVGAGSVTVAGWALDPDTRAAVAVHVYVDGRFGAAWTAAGERPDVDRAFGLGAGHGFGGTLAVAAGRHEVCAWAIDATGGVNVRFGCRTVDVA